MSAIGAPGFYPTPAFSTSQGPNWEGLYAGASVSAPAQTKLWHWPANISPRRRLQVRPDRGETAERLASPVHLIT
jgi:hypothetical protein